MTNPLTSGKIVVPIDFSENSKLAVESALAIAKSPDDILPIHVLVPLDSMSPGVVWGDMDDKKRTAAIEKHYAEFLAENDLQDSVGDITVRVGDAGLEITDYAKEELATLIVIPSHGYHGVKRLVLGSVAERVLRHAACSVLVLRRSDAD